MAGEHKRSLHLHFPAIVSKTTLSHGRLSNPLSFIIIDFSPQYFLSHRYRGCVVDESIGIGHLMVSSLQFFLSVMVSVTKRSYFDEGRHLHCSVGIRKSILNAVRNYTTLGK